jgi:hypothetical protein
MADGSFAATLRGWRSGLAPGRGLTALLRERGDGEDRNEPGEHGEFSHGDLH